MTASDAVPCSFPGCPGIRVRVLVGARHPVLRPCSTCTPSRLETRETQLRADAARRRAQLLDLVGLPARFRDSSIAPGSVPAKRRNRADGRQEWQPLTPEEYGGAEWIATSDDALRVLAAVRGLTLDSRTLVLAGGQDAGKTHLAAARAGDLVRMGVTVRWVSVPALALDLGATYGSEARRSADRVLRSALEATVLVMDGVPSKGTEALAMALELLLRQRLECRLAVLVTCRARNAGELQLGEVGDLLRRLVVDCGRWEWLPPPLLAPFAAAPVRSGRARNA